jgi:HNH endonuclease
MKKVRCKTPRLRLNSTSYRELHQRVLERDGWRYQVCGSMQQLQVHHLKLRSQSGGDVEQNLITLCAECHEQGASSSDLLQGPAAVTHLVSWRGANECGLIRKNGIAVKTGEVFPRRVPRAAAGPGTRTAFPGGAPTGAPRP